jgi:hypothetical protein
MRGIEWGVGFIRGIPSGGCNLRVRLGAGTCWAGREIPGLQFIAKHQDIIRRFNAYANFVAANFDNGHNDRVAKPNSLGLFAGKH